MAILRMNYKVFQVNEKDLKDLKFAESQLEKYRETLRINNWEKEIDLGKYDSLCRALERVMYRIALSLTPEVRSDFFAAQCKVAMDRLLESCG